ncbi:MAG: hypothetical protein AABX11_02640 [Nanoarchaeota archaeon]
MSGRKFLDKEAFQRLETQIGEIHDDILLGSGMSSPARKEVLTEELRGIFNRYMFISGEHSSEISRDQVEAVRAKFYEATGEERLPLYSGN